MRRRTKVEEGSDNVFADIGLQNPEEALVKADVAREIIRIISERKITQVDAADLLGIGQPRVSELKRGRLSLFSLEKLLDFAKALGNQVEIHVKSAAEPSLKVLIGDDDSNARIVENTEISAYNLMVSGAHLAPVVSSTFGFFSSCHVVRVKGRGTFSVNDFTRLPYGQSRYTGQTIDPNGEWISVEDPKDSVIHARYRTADHTQARRDQLRSLGQVQ